jgi:membrane-associated phospholipid phosphatase
MVFLASFLFVTFLRPSFHSLDVSINMWMPSIQTSRLTLIATGIAFTFDTPFLVMFSLVIASYLFFKNFRAECLFLLGAMGGDALFVSVFKGLIESPRPLNSLEFASGFSYPSGHTAGSIVFCGSIAFIAWQQWKTTRAHASIVVGTTAITSVVGFSRLYLNVHWLSDVTGAAMLGIFWLSLAVLVFKLLEDAGKFEGSRFRLISLPLFAVAVVIAVLVAVCGLLT